MGGNMSDSPKLPDPEPLNNIRFAYIKAPLFRTIHVDGALGGVTARGFLTISVYSERKTIPRIVDVPIKDQALGKEIIRSKRANVTRELEANLVLDLKTAKELISWLERETKQLADVNAAL